MIEIALNQNNIITDALDAAPRNDKILPTSDQSKALTFARHDDRQNTSVTGVHLHIRHKAEPCAVTDIDHLLAFQRRKTIAHSFTSWHTMYQNRKKYQNTEQSLIFCVLPYRRDENARKK